MHICLFTPTFLPKIGGAETAIDRIARGITALGHHVTVLAQYPSKAQPLPMPTDLPYDVARFSRPFSRGIGAGLIARHLERLHRRHPIDAVQAHFLYYTGWAALKWCAKRNIPLAIMAHGDDLNMDGRYRRRALVRKRIRNVLARAKALIAISESARSRMVALEPRAAAAIHVVPHGVDADWARQPVRVDGLPARYCACISRLAPGKGVNLLLAAYADSGLASRGVGLVVVGGSEGVYEDDIKRLAEATPGVVLTGKLAPAQCAYVLKHATFAVFPSVLAETFGLGLLEAAFAGTPMLASEIPAYSEFKGVLPGLRFVPVADRTAFRAALVQMADSPPAPDTRSPALTRYSLENVCREYLQLFDGQGVAKRMT